MNNATNNFFVSPEVPAPITPTDDRAKNSFAATAETYWRAMRRHMIAVMAIVFAALILALIATLLATPSYTASARLEISREAAKITNVESVEPDQKNQDLEFYQTQYALLTARTVAERVAGKLGVVSSDRLFDALDYDIDTAVAKEMAENGNRRSAAKLRIEKAADLLLDRVAIRPVPGSRLVDVAFRSPSAAMSAEVANLWVQQFQESTLERRFSTTADARAFLERRLAELRRRLEDSQRQLVAYAANKEIIILASDQDNDGNTESSETLRSSNLRTLNAALANATAQRIAAQSQATQAGSANHISLGNVALNTMREKRAEAAAELERQRSTFTAEYPPVRALRSQVAELDRSIKAEEVRIQRASQSAFLEARDRESQLQQQVSALKQGMIGEQRDSIQYSVFQREVDTNRELYQALLQRYKEIGVAGVQASNIAVVDDAKVPEEPTSPSLPLNLALGLLSGFALAGAYVFVREQLDQSIKDPASVQSLFGLPLLGAIPQQSIESIESEIADPKSTLSEAYFSAVSNLSFLTAEGAPKSIAVTSTRPNEGKSTTAFALAVAMSRVGKSVVLVDCDLRNPSQHELFGVPKEPGLSNMLNSSIPLQDIAALCRKTDTEGLTFLPAGPLTPNPGTLLSGDAFRKVVQQLATMFDHVIVDGPPLLGLADAPLMAHAVEGVVYVIEANGLRVRAIETGLRRLQFTGAQLFGAIVTKLNNSNTAYGYGDRYGYGYSYGGSDAPA